jgi:putative ABC transport system permease protein
MKLRDFRIGWRLLIKEPGYSAVVLLGLSIGFAVCFLLLGYVRYSLSYDNTVPQADRVFLIEHKLNTIGKADWLELTPLPFLAVAQKSGLLETSSLTSLQQVPFKVNNHVNQIDLLLVHPSFQQMLAIHPLEGDLQDALTRPDHLAVTESTAIKLFGDLHVVGKTVRINDKPYVISALLRDPPTNSSIGYAALGGVENTVWPEDDRKFLLDAWANIGDNKIFVKLKPGVSAQTLNQILQEASDHSPYASKLEPEVLQKLGQKKVMEIRLVSLPDMYFDSATNNAPGSSPHGDRRTVFGLAAVAVLILLLAATNYVNLATVRTLGRQREIAVRKVMGASINRLVSQFLAESLLVALIATVVGLLVARLLLPLFSDLVNRQLEHVFTPMSILGAIVLGFVVGILAGIYPAWVAIRVRPPQTLAGRGSSETSGGLWLRRVLTVLQFSTAMGLTSVTLAIAWQTYYATQANPGFDPAPMLVLDLPDGLTNPASKSLHDALERVPGVTGVAVSASPVGRKFVGGNSYLVRDDGSRATVVWRPVSSNFFEVFGLHPVAGRLFDKKTDRDDFSEDELKAAKEDVIVLNLAAVHALGYATPEAAIGQILTTKRGQDTFANHVIGVAPDIRHENLHEAPRTIAYVPMNRVSVLTVKTSGDVAALESEANKLVQKYFPDDVVEIRREQSYFAENYADDLRLAKLLGLASLIAIAIASFGIYVLSTYSVQRLSKQIVIRKLFGAKHIDIVKLVGREFIVLIIVGGLIGLPIATLINQRYLATFVEQAPVGVWTLVAALVVALLATFVSTLRHTLIALRMAPAFILRD